MSSALKRALSMEDVSTDTAITVEAAPYTPLTPEQLQGLLDARPHPEDTLDHANLRDLIDRVWFNYLTDADGNGKSMACTIKLKNGFELVGVSMVLNPENHIRELGEHFAFQKAYGELCVIGSYLQMEKAYQAATTA